MAKRGRPCGFDREQALRRALDVFWEAGYEGATMAALKEAMGGICAPSMYAAYGSKEALFRSAVELYLSQECQLSKGAFALPTARESIAALLESAAVSYTTEGKPRGLPSRGNLRRARLGALPRGQCRTARQRSHL
ncbi:TetR/AcrR family transcriptional regulator, partial [Pseudomonas aeruginosa]